MARSRRWRCPVAIPLAQIAATAASRPRSSRVVGRGQSSLRTRIDLLDFVTVEIRRPDPTTDFDEVLALVQACDRAVYDDSDWTAAELREEWDELDLDTRRLVAVDEGRIAGVVHVYGLRGTRVLLDGYVHPSSPAVAPVAVLDAVRGPRARAGRRLRWATRSRRDGAPRGRPEGAGAPRRPRLHDAAHLPPHDHRPRAGSSVAFVARRPRVGRPNPSGTPDSSRMRSTRRSPTSGVRRRDYELGRARARRAAVRPGADPGRLGRRRDRRAWRRLSEAPRRLGPDLAARRAARVAPAGARAVAAPGELRRFAERGETRPRSASTARTRPARRASTSARGCGSSGAPMSGEGAAAGCLSSSCRCVEDAGGIAAVSTRGIALGGVTEESAAGRGALVRAAAHRSGVATCGSRSTTTVRRSATRTSAGRRMVTRRRGSISRRPAECRTRSSCLRVGPGRGAERVGAGGDAAVLRRRAARGLRELLAGAGYAIVRSRSRWSARSRASSSRPSGPPA